MTRIIRVETCDRCPHAYGSRGCRHPDALVEVAGVLTIRMFNNYFVIPDWCPLEQVAPDCYPRPPPYKVVLLLKSLKTDIFIYSGPPYTP